MLTYTELPGFPLTDQRLRCLGCRCPQFIEPNHWVHYTPEEFEAWARSIAPQSVSHDHVFQDPRGNVGRHVEGCSYAGVPPIALWQGIPAVAYRAYLLLVEARQPVPPPAP